MPATLESATVELARSLVAEVRQLMADAIDAELARMNDHSEAVSPDGDTQKTKRCARCHVVQPLADFPADPLCADGHRATCNACRRRQRTKTKTTPAKPAGKRTAKAKATPQMGNGAAGDTMVVDADRLADAMHVATDAVAAAVRPFIDSGLVKLRPDGRYDIDRTWSREIAAGF